MKRFLGALAVLLICAQSAFAGFGITSGSANATVIAAPADGSLSGVTTGTGVSAWLEGISTVSGLAVDHNGSDGTFGPGIPSSTLLTGEVRSYMIDFNPDKVGDFDPVTSKDATFTFSNKILGVIFTLTNLNASDSLGSPPTTYDSLDLDRGLELVGDVKDKFTISGNTLKINAVTVSSGEHIDQFRVITAVPEPATLCTWGLLGLGLAIAVRRKWLAK